MSQRTGSRGVTSLLAIGAVLAAAAGAGTSDAATPAAGGTSPIQHVVIVYQENHSFDNVLGPLCVQDARCDGATTGKLSTGVTIALARAADLVPILAHDSEAQTTAIDGGAMDGFDLLHGCAASTGYRCYAAFQPDQIPNLAALVRQFAVSDRTFEMDTIPSFGAHIEIVGARRGGFLGDTPDEVPGQSGPGWGCDGLKDALWRDRPQDPYVLVPSCIPAPDGSGPYRPSPVTWIPTLMDRLEAAGLTWRIYAPQSGFAYRWGICPTFAACLYGPQRSSFVGPNHLSSDAADGRLPSLSIVIPRAASSQHNQYSMAAGDNYLGSTLAAVMNGPQWGSTAVFIAYDDCGCFYDHVPPPKGLGVRVPVVIVSPYARPGFTDSAQASLASMLAFAEHTFGLDPLSAWDRAAYDYAASFDYAQRPLGPIPTVRRRVPAAELRWIAAHPPADDDPT